MLQYSQSVPALSQITLVFSHQIVLALVSQAEWCFCGDMPLLHSVHSDADLSEIGGLDKYLHQMRLTLLQGLAENYILQHS